MSDEDLKLAEALCSRLCHDLAGAVGAVATGAELLADEGLGGGMAAEALDLLGSSAACASHRLRFLRLALGAGGAAVASVQLRDVIAGFLVAPTSSGSEGVRLDWRDDGTGPWDSAQAKLLLNLVLLARDSLPRGGRLSITARVAEGPLMAVAAEGVKAAPADAAQALAAGGVDGLGPRGVQGYYAARLAGRLGLRIHQIAETGRVEFHAL